MASLYPDRYRSAFYPDAAAQLFPRLAGMAPMPGETTFANWLAAYGSAWRAQATHDYPWGLVAVAALREGDTRTAACWLALAEPMRGTTRWNVLEEAIYQGLSARLQGVACANREKK